MQLVIGLGLEGGGEEVRGCGGGVEGGGGASFRRVGYRNVLDLGRS